MLRPGQFHRSPIREGCRLAHRKHTPALCRSPVNSMFNRQLSSGPNGDRAQRTNRTSYLPWIVAIGLGGSIAWAMYSPNSKAYFIKEARERETLVILGTGWGSVSFLRKLDTEQHNVIVISPQNYFLFTPLLPSCTTGLVDPRSLMEPVRSFFGDRQGAVKFYEAEAVKIDYDSRVIHIQDPSGAHGQVGQAEIPFDMLVMGVGADNATFNIPGVNEHACFLKTISDAQKVRNRIVDRIEAASFKDKSTEDIQKQLQVVVVGGGPTGVEFAAELQDFVDEDLKKQIPNIKDEFQVTLIEALPNVLPMLSKELIDYTEAKLKEQTIRVMTKTVVKRVNEGSVEVEITNAEGEEELRTIPYGLLVWATGNKPKEIVEDLATQIPEQKDLRRGLAVDKYLAVKGTPNIWALGDCANSNLPPTAQVAAQEGTYLADVFNNMTATESQSRTEVQPFRYSHQGTLAYIGSELAVADLKFLGNTIPSGGFFTYLFWKAAYLNMCLTGRGRIFVAMDWMKAKLFGRDLCRQ